MKKQEILYYVDIYPVGQEYQSAKLTWASGLNIIELHLFLNEIEEEFDEPVFVKLYSVMNHEVIESKEYIL